MNNIIACYLSLKNTELTRDLILDILLRLDTYNNAISNWNKIKCKIYFINNMNDLNQIAFSLHNLGYSIHYIARQLHNRSEHVVGKKIHNIGLYYHKIGENILQNIFKLFNKIPYYYFM